MKEGEDEMPQVSRGDRAVVTFRIPQSYSEKLQRHVKMTRQTRNDLVARLVMDYLDHHAEDIEQAEGQERLQLKVS